jgi:hypothetical protein
VILPRVMVDGASVTLTWTPPADRGSAGRLWCTWVYWTLRKATDFLLGAGLQAGPGVDDPR